MYGAVIYCLVVHMNENYDYSPATRMTRYWLAE